MISSKQYNGHTLQSGPEPGPDNLEKVNPFLKFTVLAQNTFSTNSRVLVTVTKYQNKVFLVPCLKFLLFCMNICILKNWRMLISNITIVSSNFSLRNTQIKHFWPQICKLLICANLCILAMSKMLV